MLETFTIYEFEMKGDFVIVRSLTGPLLRRVLESNSEVVFISSDEQYELHIRGLPALDPVGFRREYVFEYDPQTAGDIAHGAIDWTKLTPYRAQA